MKSILSTLLLSVALSACTGTFEPANPVLLVVGYGEGDEGRVALIEDSFGESGPAEDRLEFLEDSVRMLPAPAVAYDVTDRERARGRLVVLSREAAVAGSATGYLTFFSLRGVDPASPTAFVQTAMFTISTDPEDVEIVPDTLISPQFCPSSVQVTQSGAFAAVLNEPALCGGSGLPSIDIFELPDPQDPQGEQIRLLQRIERVAEGGAIYLSQSAAQDLLYYAVNVPGNLRLQRAVLPRPGSFFTDDDRVIVEPVATVETTTGNDLVDVGRAGTAAEERLVLLFEDSLVSVTGFTGSGEAGEAIDTPPNNAGIIRDDRRVVDGTLILGTPAAQRFSYVPPSTEADILGPESARVIAVDATIEPTYGFVYFVADQTVSLFDLNSYDIGDPLRVVPLPVLELTDPTFVTWTQSVPALP
jgi:hypothetical protein